MLYSETELKKRLKSGCPVFYFYASDEALVRSAAAKAEKFLSEEAPDTTTLDGPTPSVEDIVLAAGTISFFGGRRLVMLPLIRPSAYSDKDLQELCDTLSDTENAVFVLTSLLEEKYGKIKPGKREQKLITACEKLGYCVQIAKPGRAALQEMARTWAGEYHTTFAPGAEAALLDRCGDDQFLLQNEIAKLAALSGYTTITTQMIQQLGTVTLDADTFDMVKLVAAGNTRQALAKLQTLLELQNEPILITGALIGNYLDIYRAFLAKKSRRPLADREHRVDGQNAVEPAADDSYTASEPGLVQVDDGGFMAFYQAQFGDSMTKDCLDRVLANRLPTRIAALSGQPTELTLHKRSGADHCYDFSADLQAADGTTTASVTGTITMVKEDGAWKASDLTLNLK